MEDQKPDCEPATESAADSANQSSPDNPDVLPESAPADSSPVKEAVLDGEKSIPGDKDKRELTVLDLGVGVLLLTLMAFVVVNVYVMYVASRYNDTICKNSIDLAKVAALEGKDTDSWRVS